jgi:hypothetical protein
MAISSLPRPSGNDMVLLVSLMYPVVDIQFEWATFSTCRKPLHQWLLASFALLVIFRTLHTFGTHYASAQNAAMAGDFLMNLRLKGAVPQCILYLTWFVVMPCFTIWTLTGSKWTWEVWTNTPQCLPAQYFWFSVLWQLLSYFWIAAHAKIGFTALCREWTIRSAESDLRAMEDPDTLERWGNVSQHHSLSESGKAATPGLTPAQIIALRGTHKHVPKTDCFEVDECPICLAEFCEGDSLRRLPNCVHTFHRSCIDLWLLQSASCPLCKVEIKGGSCDSETKPLIGSFSV